MSVAPATKKPLRFAERYPHLGTGPIPSAPFLDPEYYEKEKAHIFKKTWLHVGRVEEIPKKGDFFVRDLPACDANIIVIRSSNDSIKAFHNVCSHRQNAVVYEESGHLRKFFCKFHGWAYDLDGKLTGVPDRKSFAELNESELGLEQVSCEIWQGFIFINMQPKPAMTLQEFLHPMYAELEGYPFHKLTSCYAWNAVVNTNWKFALDANQETYHVAFVHGRSIAESLSKDEEGNLHPIDGLCDDFHRRLSIAGNPNSVYGNPAAVTSAGNGSAPAMASTTRTAIALEALRLGRGGTKLDFPKEDLPTGLNWTKHPDWVFDINVIFPNFYMAIRPNYVQAYTFYPLSHDKTLFSARVYYPEMKTAGGRFYQEYMKSTLRDVLLEDMGTLERTQAATNTRAKQWMYLQDNEIMVRHSAAVVDRLVNQA